MPCNSDYLDPTNREREHQRAAKLLVYIHERMAVDSPEWIVAEASNAYANDARLIPLLCTTMTNMGDIMRDNFTYKSAKLPIARDLADWWETHQAADKARADRESRADENARLRFEAWSKLTADERLALGITEPFP
jgi:hypothetical protein